MENLRNLTDASYLCDKSFIKPNVQSRALKLILNKLNNSFWI